MSDTDLNLESRKVKAEDNEITLRDRFAMAALQGLLAQDSESWSYDGIAVEVYKYADAMLKERKK